MDNRNSEPVPGVPIRNENGRSTKEIHVKGVPVAVWLRARQNALQSGLPFKDFVIRLLESSEPVR